MTNNLRNDGTTGALYLLLAFGLLIILAVVLQPAFEARTFNKFRPNGAPKATYWDAVWAKLIVTGQ